MRRRGDLIQLGITAAAVTLTLAAVLTTVGLARSTTSTQTRTSAQSPTTSTLPGSARTVLAAPHAVSTQTTLPAAAPVALTVPAVDLTTSLLIELGTTPTGAMEIPGSAQVVGWSAEGATPGERGAAIIVGYTAFGHQRGVFHRLSEVRPGDVVAVRRSDDVVATFTVYRVQRLTDSHTALRTALAPAAEAELRLLAYPDVPGSPGTSVVVFGRLTGDSA
jgi:sortase (surface protein transpeptidase)